MGKITIEIDSLEILIARLKKRLIDNKKEFEDIERRVMEAESRIESLKELDTDH